MSVYPSTYRPRGCSYSMRLAVPPSGTVGGGSGGGGGGSAATGGGGGGSAATGGGGGSSGGGSAGAAAGAVRGGGSKLRAAACCSSARICGAEAAPRLRSGTSCLPTLPLFPTILWMRLPTNFASSCEISGMCSAPVTRYAEASYWSHAYPSLALITSGFFGSYPRCFQSFSTASFAFSRSSFVSRAAGPVLTKALRLPVPSGSISSIFGSRKSTETCGEGHRELQTCAVMSGEGLGESRVSRGHADVQSMLAHILAFSEGSVDSIAQHRGRF
eukprot:4062829-Prymnesium_polylepis.2